MNETNNPLSESLEIARQYVGDASITLPSQEPCTQALEAIVQALDILITVAKMQVDTQP